jgi:cohesin domain-containing protein
VRKKRLLGWLAVAGVVGAAASLLAPAPEPEAAKTAKIEARGEARPEGDFTALPAREPIGKTRGELFSRRSWAPPPPPPPKAAPVVAAPPAPPPMPYRVAGFVAHDGGSHVVLAKGDRVMTVRIGDTLDDGYRVESIAADRVTLVYVPLGVPQDLAVSSVLPLNAPAAPAARAAAPAAAEARPAQLRWEGPARVQAGNPFDVSLKVTSDQPVRASPLQLSYDAKLLEPVAVRAGGFFSDGSFSYRISPRGSIFVGAMGKGNVAADAEFLVVTFKPIRSGTIAELTLSSVVLQGATGRAIAHDRPAAFRTTIQ